MRASDDDERAEHQQSRQHFVAIHSNGYSDEVGLLGALLARLVVCRAAPSLATTPVCRPTRWLLSLAVCECVGICAFTRLSYSSGDEPIFVSNTGLGLSIVLASLMLSVSVPSGSTISTATASALDTINTN